MLAVYQHLGNQVELSFYCDGIVWPEVFGVQLEDMAVFDNIQAFPHRIARVESYLPAGLQKKVVAGEVFDLLLRDVHVFLALVDEFLHQTVVIST